MKATAIIPSRYGSTRLGGKPLLSIAGKPMIQRVYEQALMAENIEKVIVATDDPRIVNAVEKFGGLALLTPSFLGSGTDRVACAAEMLGIPEDEIVINIQGDQPLFNPACIGEILAPLAGDRERLQPHMTTLAYPIVNPREITDPKDVKVVMDHNGHALYFSRAAIPFPRDGGYNLDSQVDSPVRFYKHLGFYACRKRFLDIFAKLPQGVLEGIEKLEQLRVLEYGFSIKVVITGHDSPEVDLPEDIPRIEALLKMHPECPGQWDGPEKREP
ncbi:MAG: 3-deoxy-manno-octulosonate cytidylyltransferase [Desulfamplus sp.]|nr:3-deoxy-manno-octulosonate cytidylyltransferase [Desulfamplus sp.]